MIAVVSKPGQLGNRLWLYAHFAGFAADHGIELVFPSLDEYADAFEGTHHDLLARFPARRSRLPRSALCRSLTYEAFRLAAAVRARTGRPRRASLIRLDWNETMSLQAPAFKEQVSNSSLVLVQGWQFRAERSLANHADDVRRHLQLRSHLRIRAERRIAEARAGGRTIVGLHVRRGDYVRFEEGRYHYEAEIYEKLMDSCLELFPGRRVTFVVCSNEPVTLDPPPGARLVPGPGDEFADLHSLSLCDLIVGPPSTYSMWASFVGRVPCWVVADPTVPPDEAGISPRMTQFLDTPGGT